MEKVIEWVTKNKRKALLIIVAIIFVPILVIHILFEFDSGCDFLRTEFEAGDVLGYWGDVLSFIGTVVLGYVAIIQTEKSNIISEKQMELDIVKTKPCFDFVNLQKYFMTLTGDRASIEEKYKREELMVLDILMTSNPRSGMCTNVGFIELTVTNSGHSDIRSVYVNKIRFYLYALDKRNRNETIAMLSGNTYIKVGETKKMLIEVRREFEDEDDFKDTWYKDNVEKIMPHLGMDLHLVTTEGLDYYETIECGTNWSCDMKNQKNCVERELVVSKLDVSTQKDIY